MEIGSGKRSSEMSDDVSGNAYAGEVTPRQAWDILSGDPSAVLIDVRTQGEWAYVGTADLSSLEKQPLFVEWQHSPSMRVNPDFCEQLAAHGVGKDAPLLFICRSGVRSKAAAIAMTAHGLAKCYNVSHGFEGDPDSSKRRGTINGWKIDGLPWVQG